MKVSDLRAGGEGVPRIFDLSRKECRSLEAFIENYTLLMYNVDFHEWPGWEDLLQEVEEAAATGCSAERAEHIIEEFAWNVGAKPEEP